MGAAGHLPGRPAITPGGGIRREKKGRVFPEPRVQALRRDLASWWAQAPHSCLLTVPLGRGSSNSSSRVSQLQALRRQGLHSPDFSTGQISTPQVQGQLFPLLPGPPRVIVYLMCFFNATLKNYSCLAQPLRKVSDSCICLFYIKLSNVLCMFFSVRNGGEGREIYI